MIENCYMQYIDYSVSELPFLMVGVYFSGDANKFLHNAVHDAAASAFLAPGTTLSLPIMMFGLQVRYNQMVPYTKAPQQRYKTLLYTITTYTTLQNMPYDLMRQEVIQVKRDNMEICIIILLFELMGSW